MLYLLGYNEIQKICCEEKSTEEKSNMIADFFSVLLKTPRCSVYTKLQSSNTIPTVDATVYDIATMKSLPITNTILMRNVTYCCHAIRLANVVYSRIVDMKTEPIVQSNETHLALLESLWSNMKPNVRRTSKHVVSPDWLALGFQGNDPTTDFRSLGLLGLYQLVYFSLHRTQTAHMVLQDLSKPGSKYYPFAVIGINISKFVMELFTEFRLHRCIFDNYRNIIMACSSIVREAPSEDENCVNYCCESIHDIYCVVFEEFYLLWVVRNPADIMSFSDLFAELQKTIRDKYASLA